MKLTLLDKSEVPTSTRSKYGVYTPALRDAVAQKKVLRLECESLDEAVRVKMSLAAMISRLRLPLTLRREKKALFAIPQ